MVSYGGRDVLDEVYFAICLNRGDCWYGTRREIAATATFFW